MSKALEALNYIINNFLSYEIPEDAPNCVEQLKIIKEELENFDDLKNGIRWRKESYKRDLERNADASGDPLSDTNRLITRNLYNIMEALESYYYNK